MHLLAGIERHRGAQRFDCGGYPHQVSLPFRGQHGAGLGFWTRHLLADENFQVEFYTPGALSHLICFGAILLPFFATGIHKLP